MKLNQYKTFALAAAVTVAFAANSSAQTPPVPPVAPVPATEIKAPKVRVYAPDEKDFKLDMKDLDIKINQKLKVIDSKLGKMNFDHRELAMLNVNAHLLVNLKGLEHLSSMDVQPDYKGIEKTKVISKSYTVDGNDKLAISNQYGTVAITTWAKNEIKVDVEIKAYENSESAAQELLDNVTVFDSKVPNLISFKTDIKRDSQNWFVMRKNGKEERRGVQVNYLVYMPSKNPLDVTNKYGNTTVPDFDGELNIVSSYGSFSGKSLKNSSNKIKVSYGSATIENLKASSLEVSYGSLKLAAADRLNASVGYSPVSISKLTGDGTLSVKYGSLKIEQVDDDVKNLNVNASYTSVSLGFAPASNFNFDVTVHYSGFNYDKNKVNVISTDPSDGSKGWNPTKNYKGTYGKGSTGRIVVNSNYGGVKFL